jgi:hypothetical protein
LVLASSTQPDFLAIAGRFHAVVMRDLCALCVTWF